MDKIKNFFIKYREILMYLFIGGCTTLVSWITYAIGVRIFTDESLVFGLQLNILIANAFSWILAVIFAYITNKIFVFRSLNWKASFVIKEILLFFSSRVLTGIIEILAVPFLVEIGLDQTIFGVSGMLSKVIVSVLVVILNYILSKLIIFKKNESN